MAGVKELDKAVEKFINNQASIRGIKYYKKSLTEKIEEFKINGINLTIEALGGNRVVTLEQNGKEIRKRKYHLDVNSDGKADVCKDDIIGG